MSDDPEYDPEKRDHVIARIAAGELRADVASGGSSDSCPDAELLAAYADRSLDPAEAARWENHFAHCERCRRILAALLVTADEPLLQQEVQNLGQRPAPGPVAVPGPVAAPGSTSASPSAAPLKHPAVIPKRGNARWAVPAIAAAAAVILWFALRPMPPSSTSLIAQNSPAANSTLPGLPAADSSLPGGPAADSLPALPANAPGSDAAVAPNQVPPAPAAGFAPPGFGQPTTAAGAGAQAPFGQNSPAASPALDAARQQPPSAASAQPVLPPPAPAAAQYRALNSASSAAPATAAAEPAAPAAKAAAPVLETEKTTPTAGAFAGAPAGLLDNAARLEQSKGVRVAGPLAPAPEKKAAPLFTFASPDGAQWRGGTNGLIEHSVNQGRDWQPQASGVTLDLAAGSAASNQVAWVVGHAGVILRTTDGGMSWQRLVSPNATITDWAAVQATDAQHAAITSKDQHRFFTSDGGQNWTAQP